MSLGHSPKVITDGLVFYYDINNKKKSWIGRPTTNTINALTSGISRYNNPGFSGGEVNTGLTYKGCPIYELTFTPQDSSYIPRLASGEGFGAYHTFGSPLSANTYYLASIYFKTEHPLENSVSQGFNNGYSNIGGWNQNNTSATRYQDDGWTRLYTQYLNNENGYSVRVITFPGQYGNGTQFTVNTTSTQIINLSVTVPADGTGINDFSYFYAIVAATPTITVNGGLTGLTILDHGLDTTSYTKLSWPSNIKTLANLPFTYYFRVSVPSTGGTNVNINISSGFKVYTTALNDGKYWKVTFDTTKVSVGQPIKTYWCCPMIEQHSTLYPSEFVNGTRSNTQSVLDITGTNTITTNSLTYTTSGTFNFNGTSDYLSLPYVQSNPNNFTVEAWIYHTSHSSDTNIGHQIVIPYSGYNAWIFSLNGPDSKLQLRNHNFSLSNTAYNISSPTGLALNTWYHVAATDNGQTVRLYVNGSQVASIASATATSNGTMTTYIGSWGPTLPNQFFSGSIPAVRIYHRGLSAQEVQQNFNAQRGRYGI